MVQAETMNRILEGDFLPDSLDPDLESKPAE
jgi:hypothetical protein